MWLRPLPQGTVLCSFRNWCLFKLHMIWTPDFMISDGRIFSVQMKYDSLLLVHRKWVTVGEETSNIKYVSLRLVGMVCGTSSRSVIALTADCLSAARPHCLLHNTPQRSISHRRLTALLCSCALCSMFILIKGFSLTLSPTIPSFCF